MVIYEATSSNFKKYGRIVKNIDFAPVIEALNQIAIPADSVAYEPTVASLEEASAKVGVSRLFGGELKLETGYCAGHNSLLNAVEYHRSSEVNVAATDCILLLGSQQDITDDFQYDTSKIEAFHIRKGILMEQTSTWKKTILIVWLIQTAKISSLQQRTSGLSLIPTLPVRRDISPDSLVLILKST